MKHCTIGDILSDDQIKRAVELYNQYKDTGRFARVLADEVIKPNMEWINLQLGQENDPMYLAYMVEYALMQQEK